MAIYGIFNCYCPICEIATEIRTSRTPQELEMCWRTLGRAIGADAFAISLYPTVIEFRDITCPINMIRGGFDHALIEDYYLAGLVGNDVAARCVRDNCQISWDASSVPSTKDITIARDYGFNSAIYVPSIYHNSSAVFAMMSRSNNLYEQTKAFAHKIENAFYATHHAMSHTFYSHYTPYTLVLTQVETEIWRLVSSGYAIAQIAKLRGTGSSAVNKTIRQLKSKIFPGRDPIDIKTTEVTKMLISANYL